MSFFVSFCGRLDRTLSAPQNKKPNHLYTWQSGLFYAVISPGSSLRNNRFCAAIIWLLGLIISFLLTLGMEKTNNNELF
jgi:hypothetical protein